MSIKRHIPNLITSLNLVSGCIAIVYAVNGLFIDAVLMVLVAAILDFIDGLSARLLKVSSAIGKELDSLADMVTFGVTPAFFLFFYLTSKSVELNTVEFVKSNPLSLLLLLTPVLSAVRLAKFNVDTRQENGFIGLNTPTNTLLLISLPFVANHLEFSFHNTLYFIVSISIVSALLLNANIPMLSLKFNTLTFSENKFRFILIIFSVIVLVVGVLINFIAISFPIIVVLYLILSIIHNQLSK